LEDAVRARIRAPKWKRGHGAGPEHKNEFDAPRRDQMLRRLTLEHVDALFLTGALAVSAIAYMVLFTNINSILN
jgi:hypothetical protein